MSKNSRDFSRLSDEELLAEAKQNRRSPIFDATFIGFLVGVSIYGVVANSWGFFLLVPLFLIYLMLKKPKRHAELQKELKDRGLQ
jgi:hypothetical protein